MIGWLGIYRFATPGVEGCDNATVRLDWENEPQPDAQENCKFARNTTRAPCRQVGRSCDNFRLKAVLRALGQNFAILLRQRRGRAKIRPPASFAGRRQRNFRPFSGLISKRTVLAASGSLV